MGDDYIKKEDAVKAVANAYWHGTDCECYAFAHKALDNVPTADVSPIRRGHWIIKCVREYELSYSGTAYVPEYECSCCGNVTESYVRLDEPIMPDDADFPKYCEDCGARMDGESDE